MVPQEAMLFDLVHGPDGFQFVLGLESIVIIHLAIEVLLFLLVSTGQGLADGIHCGFETLVGGEAESVMDTGELFCAKGN
jgi:hypothetical protein